MLKTIYKLWWKKPTQLRAVPAYVYASDESSARTKLAARIATNATILNQSVAIDPSTVGSGSLTVNFSPKSHGWYLSIPMVKTESRPHDVLTPADLAEIQADLTS